MARVAARIPDLLFGSKAAELLRAAGHDVALGGDPRDADVVVVDLTTGTIDESVVGAGAKVLGVFAHVEPEVRERALAAGYDQVVPRSRFMREGGALVERLATPRPDSSPG